MIEVIYDADFPGLEDCPIACVRAERLIVINPGLFYAMTVFEQKFWLLHEEGHINLDTSSEVMADGYAFDKLAGTEFRSLKQMVAATEKLLVGSNPEFKLRKEALFQRAYAWDQAHE